MTPDQIQTKLNEAVMNIKTLQAELDALKSNLSEKSNSCDHYIPQPGEVVEVKRDDDYRKRIFVEYREGGNYPFVCVIFQDNEEYRNGLEYDTNTWKFCRRLHGEIIEFGCDKPKDYTHLLPTGYEFCTEEQAEKWVKVELKGLTKEGAIGKVSEGEGDHWKPYYRPIRPIQYHVALHEVVTVEPNPYAVDWANAPEWADSHAYDQNEIGVFYGVEQGERQHKPKWSASGLLLPPGLDWTKSKTVRPCKP